MQSSRHPAEHMEIPEYLASYPENSVSHAERARQTATARAGRDSFPHLWHRRMMRWTMIATTMVALTCLGQHRLCLAYRDRLRLCESTLDRVERHHSAPCRLCNERMPVIRVSRMAVFGPRELTDLTREPRPVPFLGGSTHSQSFETQK